MSEAVSNELLYEVLKAIRQDIGDIKRKLIDHDEQFKGQRHLLMAMQSDDLRHEASFAGLRADIDRIKRRLDLNDA